VNKDQCGGGVTGVATDCFWLFSSNVTGVNDGECRAKDDDELSCSDLKRSTQCVDGVYIECMWMEEEEMHCQEMKSTCSSLETESMCQTAEEVDMSCFWLREKTNAGESTGDGNGNTAKCISKVMLLFTLV
jgi:hypothetical protein